MRQTLHIFRKDVRFLRLPIVLSLALTACFAWSRSVDTPDPLRLAITALLMLSWCALAAAAIFKERPAGDRQFWITRPYRRSSLIFAKAMLLVFFIHLPLLTADLAILAAQRFAADPATLLWRQFGLAALITAPAAAIAALTRNFADMVLTALGVFVAWIVFVSTVATVREGWAFHEWVRGSLILSVLLLGAAATTAWQYARRRTAAGRVLAASCAAAIGVLMATPAIGAALAAWTPSEPAILRSVRLSAAALPGAARLRIEGVPDGLRPNVEMLAAAAGAWDSGWVPRFTSNSPALQWSSSDDGSITFYQWPPAVRTVHISVILSVYGAGATQFVRPDGRPRDTALGRCDAAFQPVARFLRFTCRNSRYPSLLAELDGSQIATRPTLYFEYLSAGPIVEFGWSQSLRYAPDAPVPFTTAPLIGRVRREIDLPVEVRR